ncbi:carbamoyl-phosphate synthase large subunit, partial [Helicobacter canadensis]
EWCKIDPYFLHQIAEIIALEKQISFESLQDSEFLTLTKQYGFSDKMLAFLINKNEGLELREEDIYALRQKLHVQLQYNEVDTCAAEFSTQTAYLYGTTPFNAQSFVDYNPQDNPDQNAQKKVLIIGGGPNRIGQGIEFDYCCVHASFALKDMGIQSIMYNCNPETVSTDYDTSDVLYFEPITFECVRSVIEREKPDGVIVHFGGQTPLKLAKKLTTIGAKIIGTSAKTIDIAEDREKFAKFVEENGLLQPKNGTAFTKEEAIEIAQNIGFPVLVRPSYVLGGRAMRIVYNVAELQNYMSEAVSVSEDSPVLIDKFLNNALELDVDVICDGKDVYIAGIMQHIEEAGIHSGDSACSIPTISISKEKIKEIEETTAKIARNLGVVGLMNTQYAIFEETLYLIEVNPRASRTVPFVSKATGIPLAKVATHVMINKDLKAALEFYDEHKKVEFKDGLYKPKKSKHIAVKESVFPFSKLSGAVMVLGPEMRSTGEVMGISESFGVSFAKSQMASKNPIPTKGKVFISLRSFDKPQAGDLARELEGLGFEICATKGTSQEISKKGIACEEALKISEGRPNIGDMLANGEIALAINTSDEASSKDDTDKIRTQVLRNNVPYFTTIEAARVAISAISEIKRINPNIAKPLQDYLSE